MVHFSGSRDVACNVSTLCQIHAIAENGYLDTGKFGYFTGQMRRFVAFFVKNRGSGGAYFRIGTKIGFLG
ncbi:MAG: hypothetical protein U5L45_23185 [Saprospiraceae bacterium]|nr:hypothetical protein [Saprospiraceae bacterium]